MNTGWPTACWGVVATAMLGMAMQAEEKVDHRQGPHAAILEYLDFLGGVRLGKRLQLQPLQNDDLKRIFNRCEFVLLRYPRYPVEVVPVEPLRSNNLLIVCDRKVTRISDDAELKIFFLQHLPVSVDAEMRIAGVRGWLRLVQELHQDGFIQFGNPSIKAGDWTVEGAVKATGGSGEGTLKITMEFTGGKLSKLSSEGDIVPGTRRPR